MYTYRGNVVGEDHRFHLFLACSELSCFNLIMTYYSNSNEFYVCFYLLFWKTKKKKEVTSSFLFTFCECRKSTVLSCVIFMDKKKTRIGLLCPALWIPNLTQNIWLLGWALGFSKHKPHLYTANTKGRNIKITKRRNELKNSLYA